MAIGGALWSLVSEHVGSTRGEHVGALGLQECAAGPAAALSSGSSRDPPRRGHPLGGPSGRPIVVCRASPRGAARDELGCGLRPFPSNVWVQPECGVAGRRGDRHADVRAACHAHCMRPYDARRGYGRDCGRAARHWLRATEPRAGKDVWVRVTRRKLWQRTSPPLCGPSRSARSGGDGRGEFGTQPRNCKLATG